MGLFKRNDQTREELEALRSELSTMRRRLEESDGEKQRLAEHIGRVEAEQRQLTDHVGDVESKVGSVDGSVDSVRAEVDRLGGLAARVDELGESMTARRSTLPPPPVPATDVLALLQQQLDELAEVIARQREHIADIAVVATDTAERTDSALVEMRSAIDSEAARPREAIDSETRTQLGLLAEKVGAIDSRVNQVSLELTNQLTELSTDLDHSGDTDTSELIDDLVARLDEVTNGQERLASEQARYAIQFRADLAELAERLRRPGAR